MDESNEIITGLGQSCKMGLIWDGCGVGGDWRDVIWKTLYVVVVVVVVAVVAVVAVGEMLLVLPSLLLLLLLSTWRSKQ